MTMMTTMMMKNEIQLKADDNTHFNPFIKSKLQRVYTVMWMHIDHTMACCPTASRQSVRSACRYMYVQRVQQMNALQCSSLNPWPDVSGGAAAARMSMLLYSIASRH